MDSYNMTLAHMPRACKPFKIRSYEKRLCNRFGIRTCKIIRLKTAWNQHLQEYGGFPPVHRFLPASEKTGGSTRATELSLDVLAGCLHHFRIITEITHCCRPRRGRQEERNTPWPPRRLQLKSAATSLTGAGWSHALAARSSGVILPILTKSSVWPRFRRARRLGKPSPRPAMRLRRGATRRRRDAGA